MFDCHVAYLLAYVPVAEMGDDRGRMHGVAVLGNYGVETVNSVSSVIHNTDGTVRLYEAILTLDEVSVTVFSLRLDVTSQGICHSIIV
jgi:hypothetical protein